MLREARATNAPILRETNHHFRAHCAPSTLYPHPLSTIFQITKPDRAIDSLRGSQESEWPLVIITVLISSFIPTHTL